MNELVALIDPNSQTTLALGRVIDEQQDANTGERTFLVWLETANDYLWVTQDKVRVLNAPE